MKFLNATKSIISHFPFHSVICTLNFEGISAFPFKVKVKGINKYYGWQEVSRINVDSMMIDWQPSVVLISDTSNFLEIVKNKSLKSYWTWCFLGCWGNGLLYYGTDFLPKKSNLDQIQIWVSKNEIWCQKKERKAACPKKLVSVWIQTNGWVYQLIAPSPNSKPILFGIQPATCKFIALVVTDLWFRLSGLKRTCSVDELSMLPFGLETAIIKIH